MADNYVEIKIKARDTAKPDLTSLKAQLDEIGSKVANAKVSVDDKEGIARLTDLNAKLAAIGKRLENPRITLAGAARVEAQLAAIDAGLDKVGRKSDDAGSRVDGLRARLGALGKTAGTIAGVGDAFGVFSKDAGMATRVLSGFSLATGLLEAPMAGLIVGVGGLAAGLVSAGAGLLAFGAIAKSQYTVASTAANQVQTAQTSYNATLKAANFAYKESMAVATTAAQRKSAATKLATAQQAAEVAQVKATAKAYDQLNPAQIKLSQAIGNAKNAWQSFVQANTTGVSQVMSQGIGLLPKVFAQMQPLLAPVEGALRGIIGSLGKDMKSSGFITFMAGIAAYTGPAITKLAHAFGNIVSGIAGVIQAFMPFQGTVLGGLDKITAKFAHWGQTLTQHSGFQSLVSMAQQDMPLVIQIVKNLGGAIVNLAKSMTGLSTFSNSKMILQLLVPLSQFVNYLSKANPALLRFGLYGLAAGGALNKMKPAFQGISAGLDGIRKGASAFQDLSSGFRNSSAAASEATGVWGTIGGKISSVGSALKTAAVAVGQFAAQTAKQLARAAAATAVWIARQTVVAATFIAENVAMAASATAAFIAENAATLGLVAAIAVLVAGIIYLATHWKQVWHGIQTVALAAWHFIDSKLIHPLMHGVDTLVTWVRSHFKLLATILATVLLGPVGFLVAFVATHWQQIVHATSALVGTVTGWFKALPGRILGALGDLGKLLWQGGVNLVMGLVHGIESMASAPFKAVSSLISGVRSLLPFSPAKKGPLSGAGSPDIAGRKFAEMFAGGIRAGSGSVGAAGWAMAGAARPGLPGGGGAGGGVLKVQLEFSGQGGDALWTWFKKEVRLKGGGGPNSVQIALGRP